MKTLNLIVGVLISCLSGLTLAAEAPEFSLFGQYSVFNYSTPHFDKLNDPGIFEAPSGNWQFMMGHHCWDRFDSESCLRGERVMKSNGNSCLLVSSSTDAGSVSEVRANLSFFARGHKLGFTDASALGKTIFTVNVVGDGETLLSRDFKMNDLRSYDCSKSGGKSDCWAQSTGQGFGFFQKESLGQKAFDNRYFEEISLKVCNVSAQEIQIKQGEVLIFFE